MAAEPADQSEAAVQPAALISRLAALRAALRGGLSWANANRLWAAVLLSGVVASIGSLALLWAMLTANQRPPETTTLEAVLSALDSGALEEARRLAIVLQNQPSPPDETPIGGPAFALGAATAYEAESMAVHGRGDIYLLAARHLEDARARGFPPGRESQGLYLLGLSLLRSGQPAAARSVLSQAALEAPERATDLRWLLAEACMSEARPKLAVADEYLDKYLADRRLTQEEQNRGLLRKAEIKLRQGDAAACGQALAALPAEGAQLPEALLLKGRLLLRAAADLPAQDGSSEARQAKLRTAIEALIEAESHDTLAARVSVPAMYLVGEAYRQMPDRAAALSQFERVRRTSGDSPEALASWLQTAELLVAMDRYAEGRRAIEQFVTKMGGQHAFSNPYLTLDEVRQRVLAIHRSLVQARQFKQALGVARCLAPVFSSVRSLELSAETRQLWGDWLTAEAEKLRGGGREEGERLARAEYRAAAADYRRLARMQIATRRYTDLLWSSAELAMAGRDYPAAIEAVGEYRQNEARRRAAQALLYKGEALLALGEVEPALDALSQCIEYHPRDPAVYRARLLAAHACLEKGAGDRAEGLLDDNLEGSQLTPDSKEWRESLYLLGQMLHTLGRYRSAALRLEMWLKRYPDATEAVTARYLLADCQRRLAAGHQAAPPAAEADADEPRELWRRALDNYQGVRESLVARSQSGEQLSPSERAMLRASDLAAGSLQMELGDYEEALRTLLTAAQRYFQEPIALDLYLLVSETYGRSGRPLEARVALKQARALAERGDAATLSRRVSTFDRGQWMELLGIMSEL